MTRIGLEFVSPLEADTARLPATTAGYRYRGYASTVRPLRSKCSGGYMFLGSHGWQPFGVDRFTAAKPHKGRAIRLATAGGTGIWPSSQFKASAESSVETTNTKPAAKRLRFIDGLYFYIR
jgi:hypothetical protein